MPPGPSACWKGTNQVALMILNAMLAVAGAAMLAFAVQRKISAPNQTMLCMDQSDVGDATASQLLDPFVLLISFGAILLILGVYGFCGACCVSEKMLLPYFTFMLICAAGMLYASLFCFLFADKANDYIEAYWPCFIKVIGDGSNQDAVKEFVNRNLKAAGAICICGFVIVMSGLHGSAVLMGYKVTAVKSMRWTNGLIFLIGVVVIGLGFKEGSSSSAGSAESVGQQWLPYAIGSLGCVAVVISLLGWCAAVYQSMCCLALYFLTLLLLGILVLSFLTLALVDSDRARKMIVDNWDVIQSNVVNVSESDAEMYLWQNLTLLGVAGMVLLVFMVANLVSSAYLMYDVRRERRRDALEAAEEKGLLVRKDEVKRKSKPLVARTPSSDEEDEEEDEEGGGSRGSQRRSSKPVKKSKRKSSSSSSSSARARARSRNDDSDEDDNGGNRSSVVLNPGGGGGGGESEDDEEVVVEFDPSTKPPKATAVQTPTEA